MLSDCTAENVLSNSRSSFPAKWVLLGLGSGCLLGLLFILFQLFFDTQDYSPTIVSWHKKFEEKISHEGSTRLGDLVEFKWDRIYFLGPYEQLFDDDQRRLFANGDKNDVFGWRNNQNYWAIVYTRQGRPPFFIRMASKQFALSGHRPLWTADSNARLRLIKPGTVESTWCSSAWPRCLAIDDDHTKIPTEPAH